MSIDIIKTAEIIEVLEEDKYGCFWG